MKSEEGKLTEIQEKTSGNQNYNNLNLINIEKGLDGLKEQQKNYLKVKRFRTEKDVSKIRQLNESEMKELNLFQNHRLIINIR